MDNLLQIPSERERESDRLFLEFAVKKCALTLSKAEILILTEQFLAMSPDREVDAILAEYGRDPKRTAPAPDVPEETPNVSTVLSEDEESAVHPPTPASDNPQLPDIDWEMSAVLPPKKSERGRNKLQKKKKSIFGDLLFYGVLIALIVGVVILTGSGQQGPHSLAGFTIQTVLTSSMESVYPKGSLVISRYTEPDTLEIGDDITFMTNETTTVTHRITGIVEDYADTGQRAFQTQGVMNAQPDSQLVPAVNVVGKVVFHSYAAGKAVDFLGNYWPLLLFFLVILAVLTRVLIYIYRKDNNTSDTRQKLSQAPRQKPVQKTVFIKEKP